MTGMMVNPQHSFRHYQTSPATQNDTYHLFSLRPSLSLSLPSSPLQVTESLDRVKAEMDERGSNMIDAGPLVRIKQALTRLKTECTQMDVRIGVVWLCINHCDDSTLVKTCLPLNNPSPCV